jgi:predicted TIM-barrel fold metal-dependent hydrolase
MFPRDINIIDTLLDIPMDFLRPVAPAVAESLRLTSPDGKNPAPYLFKSHDGSCPPGMEIATTLAAMDKHSIETAVVTVPEKARPDMLVSAIKTYPKRFIPILEVDPNGGMKALRAIVEAHTELGIVGVSVFPPGYQPAVPINDKRMYPIYAKCIELDIAVFSTSGVPGPLLPFESQYTGLVDEVCHFFPELRFILRHGCEPWVDLAVKLLLKWPNLYYSTSAFSPKYYPKAIIDFANTRGSEKIIYAGYYPHGLTLDRIFSELESLPLKPEVWPKFLRTNAIKALNLQGRVDSGTQDPLLR